jgi:hypothetical protein
LQDRALSLLFWQNLIDSGWGYGMGSAAGRLAALLSLSAPANQGGKVQRVAPD